MVNSTNFGNKITIILFQQGGFMGYIINKDTYFLMKNGDNWEIIEKTKKLVNRDNILNILNESCFYYGSSYFGRKKATKYLLGISSKAPIILNEKENLLLFPIFSLRSDKGLWFIYHNIVSYKKVNNYVEVTFLNGETYLFLLSFTIFKNQYLKCGNLLAKITLRK